MAPARRSRCSAIGYFVVLRWRRAAQVRFTQVDLLDEIAPHRPGWRRHVVAVLQLAGLAIGVVAIARPIDRTSERERSQGRILVLFDVSLSMMADRCRARSVHCRPAGRA